MIKALIVAAAVIVFGLGSLALADDQDRVMDQDRIHDRVQLHSCASSTAVNSLALASQYAFAREQLQPQEREQFSGRFGELFKEMFRGMAGAYQ